MKVRMLKAAAWLAPLFLISLLPLSARAQTDISGIQVADAQDFQGRLAFSASIDGDWKILVIDFRSKTLHLLIDSNGNDWYPGIDPSGSTLAFVSDRSGKSLIYIADWDGENQRPLREESAQKNSTNEGDPSWLPKPNQKKIIFYREEGKAQNTNLVEFDLISKREKRLTNFNKRNTTPRYSPDGNSVAFSTNRNWPGWDVCVFSLLKRTEHCVLQGLESFCRPQWSPDGKLILHSQGFGDRIRLASYMLANDSSTILSSLNKKSYDAVYAGDKDHLFFVNNSSGKFELYSMTIGQDPVKVLQSQYDIRYLAWHPNDSMQQEISRLKKSESKK